MRYPCHQKWWRYVSFDISSSNVCLFYVLILLCPSVFISFSIKSGHSARGHIQQVFPSQAHDLSDAVVCIGEMAVKDIGFEQTVTCEAESTAASVTFSDQDLLDDDDNDGNNVNSEI